MTCSRNLDRLLRASCLGLVSMLAAAGCGGGSGTTPNTPDSGNPKTPDAAPPTPDVGPQLPKLAVSPASLNFGEVDLNASSPAMSVTVTNTGALVALTPIVDNSAFAVSTTTCGVPAASCTISVVFTPISLGAKNGTLTVANGITVSLGGVGRTAGTFTAAAAGIPTTILTNQSAAIIVTVTATGALTGLSCTPSGSDLAPDTTTTTCTGAVDANGTCKYGFTFKAATAGDKNENIVCSANGTVRTVIVNPTVVTGPSLTVTPTVGTFSAGVGGTPSTAYTFNVGNAGGSATGILATVLSGVNAAEFSITNNACAVPLDSHATCAIVVVFTPASAGARTATLTVTDATASDAPVAVTLTGTGISGATVNITGAASLGTVDVGKSSAPITYTVTNSGGTATGALAVAANSPTLAISGDTCTGAILAPTKTCSFVVVFTPTTASTTTAVLSVTSAGSPLGTWQVTGIGHVSTPPALVLSPTSLDFGTIGVGLSSTGQVFTVTNSGGTATAALVVTKADGTSAGGATQFIYTSTCQAALDPGATCQVAVTFKPTIAGSASATFTISDGTYKATGTASGTSLDKPGITLACPQTAFDDTVVGLTSATVVCTVTNNIVSKQATGPITATPTGDFAVLPNSCPASLDPGQACTLSLAFKPTAKGARTGTITVTGTNGGTANLNLTGNGLGIIQIQEFTAPASGFVPTLVAGGTYDFGAVSAGATAPTTVILAVYVRGAVGNLSVAKAFGTPADFTQVAGAVDLTWPGTATHTPVAACIPLTTTAPTPSATIPYCTMVVSFTPQSKAATKTGTVTATGANAATDAATVTGKAAGPISVDPSPLTFAAVAKGTAGTAMTLTVCNNAATAATGASFAITGPNQGDFSVALDQVSNATIAGKSCVSLALRLDIPASETATTLSATLTVSATVAGVVESDVASLVGTASSGATLQATLGTSTFADTAITDTSAPATVTISNTGGVGTGGLTFTIPSGSEFSMKGGAQGTCAPTCSTNGLTCTAPALAAAGSCTLKVWFNPTPVLGVSGRSDILSVSSDTGALAVVPLAASALSQITASPGTVALGLSGTGATPSTTVTAQNIGGDGATIAISFQDFGTQTGNAIGAFQTVNDDCTGALAAGATCPVRVQMTATKLGIFSTTMLITNSINGQSASVVVTGTAAEAVLQFTPVTNIERSFGTVPRGSTSAPITYTVKNVGGLTSGTITFGLFDQTTAGGVTGPGPAHAKTADFVTTGTTCGTGTTAALAPGGTCDIVLAFNPTCVAGGTCTPTDSPLTEYLVVQAAPGVPTGGLVSRPIDAATTLTGTVVSMVTGPTATPPNVAPYDFGTATAAQTVTLALYNPTTTAFTLPATATFASLGLAGTTPAAGEFQIVVPTSIPPGTCDGFGGGTTALPAGTTAAPSTCTFRVRWTPGTTVGTRAVSVTVGGVSMNLYARVVGTAKLVANPSALNFGSVSKNNGVTATLTVVVTNVGDAGTNGNLVAPTKTGVGNGDLNFSPPAACTGSVLGVGAFCSLVVSLNPSTVGAVTTTSITVASPTAGETVTIPVSWTGTDTNPAAINLSATTVDLGPMAVMATSAAQTITLTNPAKGLFTGPLSFAINNQDFAVDAGTCGTLAHADGLTPTPTAADACNVTVTFRPRPPLGAAPDNRVGYLTIASAEVATQTVTLQGRAIAALSVSDHATATAGEDPLVAGGCTFTDATGTTPATCAYGTRATTLTTYRSETYTFQNAAGTPATGSLSVDLTGTGATSYRVVKDTCTGVSLDSSGTCKVTVRFAPASALNKAANLTVSGNLGDSVTVNLTGAGS
jgi:hypothetical protein